MKIIALLPVKNEEWIVNQALSSLELYCDKIIVADQNSVDNTKKIIKNYKKVEIIENNEKYHSNKVRWKLLEHARKSYEGINIILAIDADELLSSNILYEIMNKIYVIYLWFDMCY